MDRVDELTLQIAGAAAQKSLLKITLSRKRVATADLQQVFVKPVVIKNLPMLSFVYRYPAKDITKNFSHGVGIAAITEMLLHQFFNADVFTTSHTIYFSCTAAGKQKLVTKKSDRQMPEINAAHDKQKNRIINSTAIYLERLGITNTHGMVKKDMQHKFKQINRYVEIVDGILKDIPFTEGLSVADMGSGKGYLTFALYDYLQTKNIAATVTGIELRPELVAICNDISHNSNFTKLHFVEGSIQQANIAGTDILIALHACDTATDDAIYKGIKAGSKIIMCAPCCHKQIRREMNPDNIIKNITRHGILMERQAEMLTDTIRSMILEAHGYKTKIFEFIHLENTPKNILIVGIKNKPTPQLYMQQMEKVQELKKAFGIKSHYLETLL